jgi:hypothetical protein
MADSGTGRRQAGRVPGPEDFDRYVVEHGSRRSPETRRLARLRPDPPLPLERAEHVPPARSARGLALVGFSANPGQVFGHSGMINGFQFGPRAMTD